MRDAAASRAVAAGPGTAPKKRVWPAWLLVAAWTAVILGLGSASFSADDTSRFIGPLLRWLFPDLPPEERRALHEAIRKLAHVGEYAVLAGLALRAGLRSLAVAGAAALALGIALAVASVDELRQASLDNRTGSGRDVALDVSGGALALAGLLGLRAARRREGGPR